MSYEITDNLENTTDVMSEDAAEAKYGRVVFNEMVAGVHDRYSAINLSVDADDDFSFGFEEDFSGESLESLLGWHLSPFEV